MIGSLLISIMNEEFVKKVYDYETSGEIGTYLENYFLLHSCARIIQYKTEINDIKKDAQNVSEYVYKVQYLAS